MKPAPGFVQIVIIVLVILFVAAGVLVYSNLKTKPKGQPEPTPTQQPTNTPIISPSDSAKEDLAQRLGTSPSSIAVVSEQSIDWPDTSLGCPKPGMVYAQVITPGYKIILSYQGKTYEYHAGSNQKPFLCEKLDKSSPPSAS